MRGAIVKELHLDMINIRHGTQGRFSNRERIIMLIRICACDAFYHCLKRFRCIFSNFHLDRYIETNRMSHNYLWGWFEWINIKKNPWWSVIGQAVNRLNSVVSWNMTKLYFPSKLLYKSVYDEFDLLIAKVQFAGKTIDCTLPLKTISRHNY